MTKMTGAQALIKALELERCRRDVRPARRLHPACLRPAARVVDPPHPRAPRAGRRPHGRGLRPRHRPARRGDGDVRAGGDEPRHAADGRLHGLDPDGRHHRSGAARRRSAPTPSRSATRSASPARCTKHNELVMTAEDLPMAIRQAFHIATTGRPGPDTRRRPQGRAAERDDVVLAERRRGRGVAARLPARRPRATRG